MDSESEDNDDYDYLSHLNKRSTQRTPPKRTTPQAIDVSGSDSDLFDSTSDSDDCLIVEEIPKEREERVGTSEASSHAAQVKTEDQKFVSIHKELNALKNEIKWKADAKTIFCAQSHGSPGKAKTEKTAADVKPFGIKSEPLVKFEAIVKAEDRDVKDIKLNVEQKPVVAEVDGQKGNGRPNWVEGERNGTNSSTDTNLNTDSDSNQFEENLCDSDRSVLLSIGKAKTAHQKPTLDHIYIQYKKLTNNSVPISDLELALNDAIQRNVIKKVIGKDSNDISYQPYQCAARKRSTGSLSKDRTHCALNTDNTSAKKSKLIEDRDLRADDETKNNPKRLPKNNNSAEPVKNAKPSSMPAPLDLSSLATDECYDIDDIDVSNSQVFATSEIDSHMFDISEELFHLTPTSLSLNSTPIKSYNHNREVVRRIRSGSPNSKDDIDSEMARTDHQNWLTEVLPRYSPFIAQKGDRVVYLRDAHEIYMNYELPELKEQYSKLLCTVEQINSVLNCDDYTVFATIKDLKFYQINYLKFSLITLKTHLNDKPIEFTVLYRPNRGICEFLVLEKLYKESQTVVWEPGEEFRSLWKKSWWIGVVQKKCVFNDKYPNSLFKCYEVQWHTEEGGRLSPWDLFPVDPDRRPKKKENGILVTREDLLEINYRPHLNEWPEAEGLESQRWRCYESKRIYNGIKFCEKNVSKEIIALFKDRQHQEIAYSINLQIIKERLKNMFYRRKEAVVWDLEYLKMNCRLYVLIKDYPKVEQTIHLLLEIANNSLCFNEQQFRQCLNKYKSLRKSVSKPQQQDSHSIADHNYSVAVHQPAPHMPSTSKESGAPKQVNTSPKKRAYKRSSTSSLASLMSEVKVTQSRQWKVDSQRFIDDLLKKDESLPYRQPVDAQLFPTYSTVISDPIDLSIIQTKLATDQYLNPTELRQDFRLMYQNAKVFTKDPKSKMRVNNKMLQTLSEDRLREIIVDWERVYSYEKKQMSKTSGKVREPISRNQLWGYGAQQYY